MFLRIGYHNMPPSLDVYNKQYKWLLFSHHVFFTLSEKMFIDIDHSFCSYVNQFKFLPSNFALVTSMTINFTILKNVCWLRRVCFF